MLALEIQLFRGVALSEPLAPRAFLSQFSPITISPRTSYTISTTRKTPSPETNPNPVVPNSLLVDRRTASNRFCARLSLLALPQLFARTIPGWEVTEAVEFRDGEVRQARAGLQERLGCGGGVVGAV